MGAFLTGHLPRRLDWQGSWCIANVHIDGTNPEAVTKYLFDKHRIFAVPIMHEEFQGIRITPNLYTTFSELDRFCEQMELIAKKGPAGNGGASF